MPVYTVRFTVPVKSRFITKSALCGDLMVYRLEEQLYFDAGKYDFLEGSGDPLALFSSVESASSAAAAVLEGIQGTFRVEKVGARKRGHRVPETAVTWRPWTLADEKA